MSVLDIDEQKRRKQIEKLRKKLEKTKIEQLKQEEKRRLSKIRTQVKKNNK